MAKSHLIIGDALASSKTERTRAAARKQAQLHIRPCRMLSCLSLSLLFFFSLLQAENAAMEAKLQLNSRASYIAAGEATAEEEDTASGENTEEEQVRIASAPLAPQA